MEKNTKDFSKYPVLIDTSKKTYIFFGALFLIGFILFLAFFLKR